MTLEHLRIRHPQAPPANSMDPHVEEDATNNPEDTRFDPWVSLHASFAYNATQICAEILRSDFELCAPTLISTSIPHHRHRY